ncbi:MAG: hypothetical protein AAFW46_07840 [Pseudomonadota bacterium]
MATSDLNGGPKVERGVLDYLLGRNLTIGAASMMLLAISGFATWSGMTDFIVGIQESGSAVDLATQVLTTAIVMALTFLMWIALRETVRPGESIRRLVTLPLYLFLALWSVGFGYGYWWSLIAGSTATREGLAGQYEDVRDAAVEITARLAAVKGRLDAVERFSERQMASEEASGGSCGISSSPGRGPLWRARSNVRDSVNALSSDIQANWISAVEQDLAALNASLGDAGAVEGETIQERQRNYERAAAEIRGRAQGIATRSNALGASFAGEMRALASELEIEPGAEGYKCYDPTLAARLREAAEDAGRRAVITLRDAAFSEGPAGVANAVKTIWTKIGVGVWGLATWTDVAADENEQLGQRDLIALLAAVGVDLGLLVLAVVNPPRAETGRTGAFQREVAGVRIASDEVIEELARSFHAAIRDSDLTLSMLQRHFVAHQGHAYLVAPNLYRCGYGDDGEATRGVAINQVIGVLDEYGIIQPMRPGVRAKMWKDDPRRISIEHYKDLPQDDQELIGRAFSHQQSKGWLGGKSVEGPPQDGAEPDFGPLKDEIVKAFQEGGEAGIFAKARRALEVAGWSERARLVPEIHALKDGSLVPLLRVIEKADGLDAGSTAADAQSGATAKAKA